MGIVETALKYEGFPTMKYQDPDVGNTPKAFDCSGFVQWVLLESGIAIPNVPGTDRMLRHAANFFDSLGFYIHEECREPGDLLFMSRVGYRPTHVAVYLGDDEMIHVTRKTGVARAVISDYCGERQPKFRPEKGYPQIYVRNPIGYKRVEISPGDRPQEPHQ